MKRFKTGCICASVLLLSGCPTGSTSNNASSQFNAGLYADFQANIHEGESTATIVAKVLQDDVRVDLIAADVFEATTATKGVLLKSVNVQTGDYLGRLPIDDTNEPVTITIQHKPVEAREDRWYPVDILNVDPGPGELVGHSGTVNFPSAVDFQGPSENAIYTDRNDMVNLVWQPAGGVDETMRLSAAVNCSNGTSELAYGLTYEPGLDDGSYDIAMHQLVYNDTVTALAIAFADHITRIFLAAVVDVLTFGLVTEETLNSSPITIETANCDIDLTLIREKTGSIDVDFDGGNAIGSTSSSVTILYRPNGI